MVCAIAPQLSACANHAVRVAPPPQLQRCTLVTTSSGDLDDFAMAQWMSQHDAVLNHRANVAVGRGVFACPCGHAGARLAGDSSGARLAGDSSGARLAGDSSGARLGGDSSGARLAGDSGGARLAGDSGGARLAGDSGGARLAGDSGGARLAGDSGGARLAGDSSGARLAGSNAPLQCSTDRASANGMRLVGAAGRVLYTENGTVYRMSLFDGSLAPLFP